MENRTEINPDFQRALILLKKRFNTPHDLISYWAMSGPCVESHPAIENIIDDWVDIPLDNSGILGIRER